MEGFGGTRIQLTAVLKVEKSFECRNQAALSGPDNTTVDGINPALPILRSIP